LWVWGEKLSGASSETLATLRDATKHCGAQPNRRPPYKKKTKAFQTRKMSHSLSFTHKNFQIKIFLETIV
jgi:hypothetical protein